MTILEHCHRSECTQVVDALQRRIAELEASLAVALEALQGIKDFTEKQRVPKAINLLKEVRRDPT